MFSAVKSGKAQCEHMFSALPLEADVAQRAARPFVPEADLMAPQQTASQFDYPSGASSRAKPFEG